MSSLPGMKRDGTMAATAQEGKEFLNRSGQQQPDEDAKTRGQQKQLDDFDEEAPPKPKVPRTGTMVATAQEGAELLGEEQLSKTRGQDRKTNPTKSPKVKRQTTVSATTALASTILKGEENMGRTRAQTRRQSGGGSPAKPSPSPKKAKKAPMKKAGTMAVTAKEGKEFLEREKPKDDKEEA